MIYMETINDTVYLAPQLIEQGREDTWFKKINGRWLITKRLIRGCLFGGQPFVFPEDLESKK
jgi:hypothetical protein